ncbi:MAG: 50S ribosomal protein L10 [Nanoarchaeota archaeon]|nr:50S ribosomal protein L10 [Nanoarchaeota archaeon]
MTQKAVANIPEKKLSTVKELKDLMTKKRTVMIASIRNIPASQFQEIGKKLRGKAIVKVPKKNLLLRAIDDTKKEENKKMKEKLEDSIAILFSDLDAYELAGVLIKNKTPAKAKVGQIAPRDIEIPAGPTELVPGPAISELGALGIQIQIKDGKIEIKEPKVVAKEGQKISQGAADIMGKLDIKPFSIGFTPIAALDNETGILYTEIIIDTDKAVEELKYAYGKALPFAVGIGYVTQETLRIMIGKASAEERKLIRIITGEPEPVAEEKAEEQTPPKEESKKEEPKADAGAGLSALFG